MILAAFQLDPELRNVGLPGYTDYSIFRDAPTSIQFVPELLSKLRPAEEQRRS